ncbi:MAG: metallophosphoesterase family protein [Lachnospiraceae bacterium]|nr:metallophosphoesterase family protein [Lachnospiraceae bacterium]
MRYYIADSHFFHEGMNNEMDKRGFSSVEEMNEYMINQWNSRVNKRDDVIILGDFSVGKGEETNEILRRLHGQKYLIEGNHDKFLNDKKFDRSLLKWIKPYEELKDNKRKVVLSHYPIICYNGQYRVGGEGDPRAYMLYGHVHDTMDERLINRFQNITRETTVIDRDGVTEKVIPCNMINCFCMFSDYVPLTLDQWIEVDRKRRENIV